MQSFQGTINGTLAALDRAITTRQNMLAFMLVRFVLMSAMVVGFSWWALKLSP